MSNHNGNANKMVSDTPRSDAHNWNEGHYDDPLHSLLDFARQLERELNAANDKIKRLHDGILKNNQEIEQTCGKVLGYPWFKDDQKNFPGSTENDGVCVGDHVAETIVSELAKRHTEALARIKRLEEALEECDRAFTKHCPEHESRYGDAWEKVRDALNRPNPFKPYWPEENQ